MFSSVTPSYDLINRLFSGRQDERWRKKAARIILEDEPQCVMDLCTGTGDLAMHIAGIAKAGVEITGFDYSRPMLDIAERKAQKFQAGRIGFILGDAADMPFTDGYFGAIGIAFAFRNLTYRNTDSQKFLAEIYRVLRPGGRFVIVESSQPANRLLRFLFHTYTKTMVYYLGSWISGNKTAYRYLANSVIDYFTPGKVTVLLQKSGFAEVRHIPLMGGVAAIHVAIKK